MRKALLITVMMVLGLAMVVQAGEFEYSGVYTAWMQTQHAFRFNADTYEDSYVVQMLRMNLSFAAIPEVRAKTRFDMAQGWWGVDNALRSVERTGTGGGSALFDYKDTNFLLHVDQAYVEFDVPKSTVTGRVGRMWYGLGNKLMVDNNYDGIQVDLKDMIGQKLSLSWAKVSEGVDGISDLEPDGDVVAADARDANLFLLDFANSVGSLKYNAFGLYYKDQSVNDQTAYVPDELQFFRARFTPQVTELMALGLTASYNVGSLSIDGEFDFLTGKDDIENTSHDNQMHDINNGDLSGFNVFVRPSYAVNDKLKIGAFLGMGSGDDDLTDGEGNVNKLRTSGFFYLTEVWEDSIMPDEEGITPQGLGAPNVRGYRELENTTAIQVNANYKVAPKVSTYLAFTLLQATEEIPAWDVNGNPDYDNTASDIGQEIDFKVSYKMYDPFDLTLRGGYFMPGDAANYLINGNTANDDAAWELKGTVTYKF